MKISALDQISNVTRNIDIPIAIGGQTMRVKLGQIIDLLAAPVVMFGTIHSYPTNTITYALGSTVLRTAIIFDTNSNKFYASHGKLSVLNGQLVQQWSYFSEWDTRSMFYDEDDNIRTDCLFVGSDGATYRFNGTTLISAGITEEQAKQLRLNTPIRVESEEEMERMIADGETVEGQIYYIPEE